MAPKRRVGARWQQATLALGLILGLSALLVTVELRTTRAQTQQIVFTGTILDSIGAPPPAASSLRLVVGLPGQTGPPPPYCAIGSTDGLGNFRLILQPFNIACTTPGTILSLRVNDVAATQTTAVPGSPGVYPINFTVPVPLGGQPLPTPTIAPLIVPSQTPVPLHTTALQAGCTQVILSFGAGAAPPQATASLGNPAALIAIWRFDNAAQRFLGYFADPSAPSDLTSLAPIDAVFICVASPTSITAP